MIEAGQIYTRPGFPLLTVVQARIECSFCQVNMVLIKWKHGKYELMPVKALESLYLLTKSTG